MIKVPPYVRDLKPYIPGKSIEELAREKGLSRIVKLASNENPLGPSPKAMAAVAAALPRFSRYGDPIAFDLNKAVAERLGVKPENVLFGAGSDSLIMYLVAAFSEPGDQILTSQGSFIGMYVNGNKLGRTVEALPLVDYRYDLDGIIRAINPRTRIVYLANPNNPTGAIITRPEMDAFIAQVPPDVLVFIDEAYVSYARECPDYPDGVDYIADNVMVARSFSKDYGLAGFRVGVAIGPAELIAQMRKVKMPFEPSFPAQVAALAALEDEEHIARTLEANRNSLERMRRHFEKLGIEYIPSYANFLLMVFENESTAARCAAECLNRGLILRHVASFGLPHCVRINSGTELETDFALEVIEQAYEQVRAELSAGCSV